MENIKIKSLLESLIFVAEGPLKISDMLQAIENLQKNEELTSVAETGASDLSAESEAVLPVLAEESQENSAQDQLQQFAEGEKHKLGRSEILVLLQELEKEYQENPARGILLSEIAGGWRFRTRPENAAIIRYFYQPKPTKLSKPSLETLAIVAYRQPMTRVEIDAIRGVDSGGVLKTLLEKNLLKIVGKKDEPGKPSLYGTTHEFLELFQLKNLKDLPSLKEFSQLEEEFQRKAAAEGVVVDNIDDIEEEGPDDLFAEGAEPREMLEALEEEEEQEILELEDKLKNLRHLERDIFVEEDKAETPLVPDAS